ncbi:MAG: polyprenyl synthetase family protein [Melioribacteraceae bacterium]|nr:polyprenyl synthetase family protein [Melioribacteraceae bacterium]
MNNIDPYKIYSKQKSIIEKRLFGLLKGSKPDSLYEPCRYILHSGGKRVRALLILLSVKAAGAQYSKGYNAAVAVEILHNFTLVHDDIMDNADKRRGMPTLHKKYDISTAILAGDNLIAVAYMNLLKDAGPYAGNIVKSFTKGIIEVCEGQSLDKEFELRNNVTLQEYLIMIKKKTAALAEMCCLIGGQIGGGTNKHLRMLKTFGRNLGIAFQLQDDLLDITGDETEFGKVVGGDLIEGKKTYLFLKALEIAAGNNKTMLLEVIKKNGIRKNQVGKYKELYNKLDIIKLTKQEVFRYTQKAVSAARKIEDDEARHMMIWLAESLVERSK